MSDVVTVPARIRQRSLISAILRAVIKRIAGKDSGVDDAVLVTALGRLALQLDHPALSLHGTLPTTIEDLLRQAVRIGAEAGCEWWTGLPSRSPYAQLNDAEAVIAAVSADALPELVARYYMLEKQESAS